MTPGGPALAVRVSVGAAESELAADALWQAGAAAVEERPGELVAAPAGGGDPAALVAAVAGRWSAVVETVDLEGALDAWRAHAGPVEVGRLVVRPPWVSPPGASGPACREVVIDPGRAFGHGAHPSTRLVLAALDELVRGGERVLDIGCGSGVLAIAALVLGAATAVAVDVDPEAVAATADNAVHNGVNGRLSVVGRADDVAADYDLVVANMLPSQLVSVVPVVRRAVAAGGTVVLSGLPAARADGVTAAYCASGLVPVGSATDDGWLALTLRARRRA